MERSSDISPNSNGKFNENDSDNLVNESDFRERSNSSVTTVIEHKTSSIISKPIKMSAAKVIFDDDDDDESQSNEDRRLNSSADKANAHGPGIQKQLKVSGLNDRSSAQGAEEIDDAHVAAREELLSFLVRKGVDAKLADGYKVHAKKTKNHSASQSRNSQGNSSRELQGMSITYSGPDGGFLASKNDVLNDIKNERRRVSDVSANNNANNPIRTDAHSKARAEVAETTLPITVGHITVLQLGRVDLRSGFHSTVQIFPVGYKCEQIINGTTISKGTMSQKIICEIEDLDGYPQFRITVCSTGDTYMASKESEVWKKFHPSNIDLDWNPSFFSLHTELLIEGMNGALSCEGYKFHAERGYGTTYITADEARKAKADFLKVWERERRNQDRQKNATMSKEEKQKNAEMNTKKMAEEKELNKKLSALEKERKEKERDEVRKRKELQKQEDAKRREQLRVQQQEAQKREKAATSKGGKDSSKQRQQIRRDVNSDIRKNRADASSTVLQFYDYEELEELASTSLSRPFNRLSIEKEVGDGNNHNQPSPLADFCSSLPNFVIADAHAADGGENGCSSVGENKADLDAVEKIILVSTTLNLLHNHLNLETSSKLDSIIACLNNIYPLGAKEDQQATEKESPGESAEEVKVETADMSVEGVEVSENLPKCTDEEEEWEESMSPKKPIKFETAASSGKLLSDPFSAKSLADLDRIQLKIVKALTLELHAVLDLTVTEEKEKDVDKVAQKLRLPLNQLTWMEIARMRVLCQVYTELGRSKDDIQHAIRGSKSSSFKSAKNVARNIRYRLAIKATATGSDTAPIAAPKVESPSLFEKIIASSRYPDDLLARMQCVIASKSVPEPGDVVSRMVAANAWEDAVKIWTPSPQLNKFMSEQDIMAALHVAAMNAEDYSDEYRRACKVLIKILGLSLAKNFIWEVNSVSDPEYYKTISNPIFLVHIASKLVDKLYNENESLSVQFYEDMRTVAINCIAYFSEFYSIAAQAQKLVAAVYRHIERWMLIPQSSDDGEQHAFPTVDQCDEKYCLLSFVQMERGSPLKCGKCLGLYSCESVYKYSNSQILPAIYPAIEIVEQASEEWICPLCLREDSRALVPGLVGSDVSRSKSKSLAFYVDEWGPSASIPWLLNTTYSRELPLLERNNPSVSNYLGMLKVLADPSCSSIPRQAIVDASNEANNLSKIASKLQINVGHAGPRNWTISERLSVLSGLCTLLRSDPFIITVIEHLYSECDRLIKIISKPNFREADFISLVRELCGEEVVSMCRGLLDGLSMDGTQEASAAYLQNQITQGRCIVCNGSTFEDDAEDVADEILLCDGCNAEAHLKCLNLTAVPSAEWHCTICKERIQQRESMNDNQFDDIDSQRFKELETALLNDLIEGSTAKLDGARCSLCGLCESDLCSPLVVAQSRAEHDAAVESYSQISDRTPLCKVGGYFLHAIKGYQGRASVESVELKFTLRGKPVGPTGLSYPFFPPISSPDGYKLMELYSKMAQSPVIAHQLCALQLFQARMNKNRHTLRRRRKVVGDRVVSSVGISTKPLGLDRNGSEYWKLPTCDDLLILIKSTSRVNGQHPALNIDDGYMRYIAGEGENSKTWKRVSHTHDIQRLVELLDDASELYLKKNIINLFLLEQPPAVAQAQELEEETMGANEVMVQVKDDDDEHYDEAEGAADERSEGEVPDSRLRSDGKKKSGAKDTDNVPVALMLRTDKGPDISKYYVIEQENAFEDEANAEADDNEDDDHRSFEYFTFGKGRSRYFAIAIVNAAGKTVKVVPKMGLTVVYQIHREGISTPLQHVPLRESWSDNMYYFSTIKFKKSGRYTISFIVERANGAGLTGTIKPLIYPVVVQAERIRCGVADALDKLNAVKYVDQNVATGRAVLTGRLEILTAINQLRSEEMSEVSAVKCALLMLYAALPVGSLSSPAAGKNSTSPLSDSLVNQIAEPQDWTDALDQAWRGAVYEATCAKSLMELTLLLEFYINKAWIGAPQHKLLQVLPNPHFAIRCATLSAVSLRIFCIDKALMYEKVQSAPRERRSIGGGNRAVESKAAPVNSAGRSKSRLRFDGDDYSHEAGLSRQRRSAATAASAKIRNLNGDQDSGDDERRTEDDEADGDDDDKDADEDEDDDDGRGGRTANGTSKRLAAKMAASQAEARITSTHWICSDCSTQNELRARSCQGCEARKPAASGSTNSYRSSTPRSTRSSEADSARSRAAAAPVQRRLAHRAIVASDEDEDGDDNDGNDDNEGDDDNNGDQTNGESTARSPRKRRSTSVSYFEDNDDEEVQEEERRRKKRKQELAEEDSFPDPYIQHMQVYERELPGKLQNLSDFIRTMASSGAAQSEDDGADLSIRILSLLRWLLSDIRTEPFWAPVDLKLYPSYISIVQTPMDLGTILSRAKKCSYSDQYEFLRDVLQVWSNCKKFNAPESLLYDYAERLEIEFKNKFEAWIDDDDKPADPDISFQ